MTTIPGWSVVISPRIAADLPKTEVRHNLLPSKIDWKGQAFPFRIRQVELRQESDLSRYQLESTAHRILKPESTRIASTNYPSIRHFQQVAMNRREPCATKLASLFDRCGPAETSQVIARKGRVPARSGVARGKEVQRRIAPERVLERVPTTNNGGSPPFRGPPRIARERVPTTNNGGSPPFRGPPRIARERVPTTNNGESRPFAGHPGSRGSTSHQQRRTPRPFWCAAPDH
jgi:hypothetical protein